jgi:parallel beta-helix repeat protein
MEKNRVFGIFVCMLLLIGTILPVSGSNVAKQTSRSLMTGSILYVGGVGPNNYTKIQDAIDNASDGDTVFVFDESSPYHEIIVVGKSIILQGEDKNSTVITAITGANNTYGVNITADAVSLSGFTIQNFSYGIYLTSNNNLISDTIFRDNYFGIQTYYENLSDSIPPHLGHNMIMNNFFINNSMGIFGVSGWNNTVEGNRITQCYFGITIGGSVNAITSLNQIDENYIGMTVLGSYNTEVYHNNFTANELGILTFLTSADHILQNNFIGNNWSAMSHQRLLANIRHLKIELGLPVQRNIWQGNYWDEPRVLPYMIPGVIMTVFFKAHAGFQFDWHPAQTPYEIPLLS